MDSNEQTTFDLSKFSITVAPASLEAAEWDYIWDEDSWNTAYAKEDGALQRYYERYPDEDRWCEDTSEAGGHWGTCEGDKH